MLGCVGGDVCDQGADGDVSMQILCVSVHEKLPFPCMFSVGNNRNTNYLVLLDADCATVGYFCPAPASVQV